MKNRRQQKRRDSGDAQKRGRDGGAQKRGRGGDAQKRGRNGATLAARAVGVHGMRWLV
ncbi:MAG: hypothetical protein OXU50_02695 [Gammaproteobacteria bacterium]|nr:hypothetical protein [Gammaproteobacteria bacterium]